MVPIGLRRWFVAHFVADMLFAVPLYVAPVETLGLLGWTSIDPIATRIAAAALFGIGIESLLARNGSLEAFRTMLTLKVIWSTSAIAGIAWSILAADQPPALAWITLAGFAPFSSAWIYYRWRLRGTEPMARTAAA